jgi:tetratricopeptide (TPR) repeat protein
MCLKPEINSAWFVLLLAASSLLCQTNADKQQAFATHLQKANDYLRDKQPNLAIPELQAAVTIEPGNIDAQGNLGVLLYFQGKSSESIPHLRAALEGRHDLVKIQGLLGLAELHTLDLEQGRKDLATAFPLIEDQRFKLQVGLELASLYTQTGDLNEAASVLAQLRRDAPDNPEVLYASYRTYTDLAGESMLALSIHAPDSAQMHQLMAHEETRQGKTNEAIAQYRKAIAIDPRLPGVHFELAELLHTSQDEAVKKEAEQEYRTALAQNPQDEKSICRLAEIDAQRGNLQKSVDQFSSAVKLQPNDADAKLGLAKALIQMDQVDKALPLLEQAVQEEPTNAIAHYRLGMLYRKNGRMEDAKREIETYKQLKDTKEKLRSEYKDLLVQPNEIRADERDEQ